MCIRDRDTLTKVIDLSAQDAVGRLAEGKKMNERMIIFLLLLAAVSIGFTIIICILITRSVIRPVNEVKKAANDIANGRLTTKLSYFSQNELGQLAADIRNTTEVLNLYAVSYTHLDVYKRQIIWRLLYWERRRLLPWLSCCRTSKRSGPGRHTRH